MASPPDRFDSTTSVRDTGLGLARRLTRRLLRRPDPERPVRYRGVILPPRSMRSRMCGAAYVDDKLFHDSGRAEAERVVERLGYRRGMKIVEIGPGLGRLVRGLLTTLGEVDYRGYDVVEDWVEWCRQHIEWDHPTFRFVRIDMKNDLYNPSGSEMSDELLPVPDRDADIVYSWGVFTNMAHRDVRSYVAEIGRILRPGGRAFLTAFVEPDVPEATVNPEGYVDYPLTEALHVVRYDRDSLFALFERHGLEVEAFAHHGGDHQKQSEIYLKRTEDRA